MKIAVIGSGISGLSAAYYLSKKHKVDLFEKEDRFGGHSHTLDISTDNQSKKKVHFGGTTKTRKNSGSVFLFTFIFTFIAFYKKKRNLEENKNWKIIYYFDFKILAHYNFKSRLSIL